MTKTNGRFQLKSAAYLVLEKDGKILLLKRANSGYRDGWYSMIAGHKDKGETIRTCIVREAMEEAGIAVQNEDLRLIHVIHRTDLDDGEERYDFFFTTDAWTGDIRNMEPEKCAEIAWFDIHNLPEMTIPYIKTFNDYHKNASPYSEHGWN